MSVSQDTLAVEGNADLDMDNIGWPSVNLTATSVVSTTKTGVVHVGVNTTLYIGGSVTSCAVAGVIGGTVIFVSDSAFASSSFDTLRTGILGLDVYPFYLVHLFCWFVYLAFLFFFHFLLFPIILLLLLSNNRYTLLGVSNIIAQGPSTIAIRSPSLCQYGYFDVGNGASVSILCNSSDFTGSLNVDNGASLTISGNAFTHNTGEIIVGYAASIFNYLFVPVYHI
jgi:hypothetical protein